MKRSAGQLEFGVLVLVTLGLVAFGLVMVYSASSGEATVNADDPAYYLKRQAIYAVIGLVALILCARTPLRAIRGLGGPLLLASFAGLVAVLVVGATVNGARRWIPLGAFNLQPSELAKLAVVVWLAAWLARKPAPETLGELFKPVGAVVLAACGLILIEPDLGTSIAIVLTCAAMLVVAGTRFRVLAGAGGLMATLALAAIWLEPYRRARLLAFLDPWADPQNTGFQTVQAMLALGSGGIFGKGLGAGVGKINYLPEAPTDMIFAVIGEELGLIGTLAVISAFVAFGWAGFSVALRAHDPFGKLLATGITALVCGQALVNLAAVLGLAPLTGIPLPFVSYGGSSLIVLLASVGILLNIASNHAARATASVPGRGRRDGGARRPVARGRGRPQPARRQRDVRRRAAG